MYSARALTHCVFSFEKTAAAWLSSIKYAIEQLHQQATSYRHSVNDHQRKQLQLKTRRAAHLSIKARAARFSALFSLRQPSAATASIRGICQRAGQAPASTTRTSHRVTTNHHKKAANAVSDFSRLNQRSETKEAQQEGGKAKFCGNHQRYNCIRSCTSRNAVRHKLQRQACVSISNFFRGRIASVRQLGALHQANQSAIVSPTYVLVVPGNTSR